MEPALLHPVVNKPEAAPRGFTLVEMIVVLTIIVTITAIALLGQSSFNKNLLLTDTAYTVAFSVREAQSLGLSSRIFNGVQNAGYGTFFSATTPTSYVLYSDIYPASPGSSQGGRCVGHTAPSGDPDAKPGDCVYDAQSELVQQYTLNRGFTIQKICGRDAGTNTYNCSDTNAFAIASIHLEFIRPYTQANIIRVNQSGSGVALTDATIYVAAPGGVNYKCVYVSSLGQISVISRGATNCP
jgi:prepilin-type N-terminal cleavage/methylation domain-containing protein